MALFCTNVCVCAKKAVLLQPLLKKADRCDIVWIIASCEVIIV